MDKSLLSNVHKKIMRANIPYKAPAISRFREDYYFLSNFQECAIEIDGIKYKNAEAAFQSLKCENIEDRRYFSHLNAKQAKSWGRKVKLRPDWEEVKCAFMYIVVYNKFSQNPDLANKLLATEDLYLIEGNNWNDRYWGVCKGKGYNRLGVILMMVREKLKL